MKRSMDVAPKEGKYIYCIIEADRFISFGPFGIGDRGDELYTTCFNDIAAVVSNALITNYCASRENLLAHEKAIEEVMKDYAVLPVRFCTIAEDEEKVRKILETDREIFKELLNKMKDKKELGIKAIFKEGAVYQQILEKYEDIRRCKEAIASKSPSETYYQRMAIGKMVEEALEKEKEIFKADILGALLPLAVEVKVNSNYGERMILNSAFLVERQKEQEFDQKIRVLDNRYSDKVQFKYVGVVPPFNFVNLVIDPVRY